MSSLYSWHDECMVRLEMKDVYAEMEQIRLLKDAGQTRPGWFARQATKLAGWLSKVGLSRRRRSSVPQYYQSTSFKFSV